MIKLGKIFRSIWDAIKRLLHIEISKPPKEPASRDKALKTRIPPTERKIETFKVADEQPEISSSYSVVHNFRPAFSNAVEQINQVQIGSVRLVLGYLSIEYVPQMVLDVIEEIKQDAISCLFEFLKRIRIDPDRLFVLRSPIEKKKLKDTVDILLEVDDIRRIYDVSPMPIYEALKKEALSKVEHMLKKMRLVADVLKRADNLNINFFEYTERFQIIKNRLEDWNSYTIDRIKEVSTYTDEKMELQREYDDLDESIEKMIAELQQSDKWPNIEINVNKRLKQLRFIKSHLINNPPLMDNSKRKSIEDCIITLRALHTKFRKFQPTTESYKNKIEESKAILNLHGKATLEKIIEAHRRESKRWHPDKNPDNPEAADKFKSVQNAYEFLRGIIETEGIEYV
jgi:hypothetical protein